eukprot:CAMPEP_0202710324 /NCGR_PEP_ID=MMETSP1385-20130828/22317_1 /ASSEMBLY_ACC=CAM_ASM_000861 /TAXON_ID=933848 /ORGANISM="Elphidium margaritaceum" /LENGTH=336 /DNA_ID=CAMNT_0049369841 /DNA_START=28 /DNA_END=1038 /DNA_ORIENTATION=-
MSSPQEQRRDLKDSIREMKREDLEDVVKVQQHVLNVTMGQTPFQHPGAPSIQSGNRYMPNQNELDFAQHSRIILSNNLFRYFFIGAFTPYFTLKLLSTVHRRVIPTQRMIVMCTIGGAFGGTYGMTLGRVQVARDYLRLENSPLATEARFQLWRVNPSHPFLRGFEQETNVWTEYSYGDSRDSYMDDDRLPTSSPSRSRRAPPSHDTHDTDDEYYGDYNQQYDEQPSKRSTFSPPAPLPGAPSDRDRARRERDYSYEEYTQSNASEMDEERTRRRKRDRFYQGRNRVDRNTLNDTEDDPHGDQSDFFDAHSHHNEPHNPNQDVADFFDNSSKQKWD